MLVGNTSLRGIHVVETRCGIIQVGIDGSLELGSRSPIAGGNLGKVQRLSQLRPLKQHSVKMGVSQRVRGRLSKKGQRDYQVFRIVR